MANYPATFVEEIVRHTQCTQTTYNIHKEQVVSGGGTVSASNTSTTVSHNSSSYVFQGYPSGNFLKQVILLISDFLGMRDSESVEVSKQIPNLF